MNYTDDQLKSILAKMLPETISHHACGKYYWIGSANGFVLDTELLHLCSLVEAGLTDKSRYVMSLRVETDRYADDFVFVTATWQQRTRALASEKEVTL